MREFLHINDMADACVFMMEIMLARVCSTTFAELVQEMMLHDLDTARWHALLESHGYKVAISLGS
jgi:hypothetical protein